MTLVSGDYEHAVLHLAWSRQAPTNARCLLFGFVELLPAELPPPLDDYNKNGFRLGGTGVHTVYVRHAIITYSEAIAGYELARAGSLCMAREGDGAGLHIVGEKGARVIEVGPFDEDLPWPHLVTLEGGSGNWPFVPHGMANPRVHHLIPDASRVRLPPWSDAERAAALAHLADQLHFSLIDHPELLGSLHFVAPNPLVRSVSIRGVPRGSARLPKANQLAVHIEGRAGADLSGLEVVIEAARPWGICNYQRVSAMGDPKLLELDDDLGSLRSILVDKDRGVLDVSTGVIIKAIAGTLEVANTRSVEQAVGPNRLRPGAGEQTAAPYQVQVVGEAQPMTVGAPTAPRTAFRALHAIHRRLHSPEVRRVERWFGGRPGDADAARTLVRQLVSAGRKRLWIVDPYFTADELTNHALAFGSARAPVRVLSSADVLTGKCATGSFQEQGDALEHRLDDLAKQGVRNPFDVRVMTGSPDVHDRFLVVDDTAYLLGSSLNTFGERGTMLVELATPLVVIQGLDEAWERAEQFPLWLASRRAKRGGA